MDMNMLVFDQIDCSWCSNSVL